VYVSIAVVAPAATASPSATAATPTMAANAATHAAAVVPAAAGAVPGILLHRPEGQWQQISLSLPMENLLVSTSLYECKNKVHPVHQYSGLS
jgi:hypothetical protein